jgi:hypothetical protein
MDGLSIGTVASLASWGLAAYGAFRLGYSALSWLDRLLFGRPRIVRRRVPGSGYVWTRARYGDGRARDYVTTGGVRVDAEAFARMYRRRPNSQAVKIVDAGEIISAYGATFCDSIEGEARAVHMLFASDRPTMRLLGPAPMPSDEGCDSDES